MRRLLLLLLLSVCAVAQHAPNQKPGMGYKIIKHPLSEGLVGCWLMNEGGGNLVYDLSMCGNNGTISDGSWVGGKYGPAVEINNATGGISIGDMSILDGLSTMSIVASAKISESAIGQTYLCQWTDGTESWQVFFDGADVRTRIDAGGSQSVINGPSEASFAYDSPFQYASVYNGATHAVYFNADLHDSSALTGTHDITSGSAFYLMSTNAAGSAWVYPVDFFYIYNRALTAGEVKVLYREPFCFMKRARPELYVTAAAPTGAPQVIMIMSAIPLFVIFGLAAGFAWTRRKAA